MGTFIRASALLAALVALSGCGPGGEVDPSQSRFLVYNYNPATQDYRLQEVPIRTLTNVSAVDGSITYLRGSGDLTVAEEDPSTAEEWANHLTVEGSNTPNIEYTIDDGLVIPWDFDSAMMLTVYHHLERSADFFDSIPRDGTDLNQPISQLVGRIPTYYYPQLSLLGLALPLFTDNAAYAYTLNAFLIPARLNLVDAVPLFANRGVMTHEYSHAVFNRLVFNNARAPVFLLEGWDSDISARRALNELQALDEGVADIFAALDLKTGDFFSPSIAVELVDRDMGKRRVYSPCMLEAATVGGYLRACDGRQGPSADPNDPNSSPQLPAFDIYHLGATTASIFWALRKELSGRVSDEQLGNVMLKSLRAIQNPTKNFRISQFFNALHDNLPAAEQAAACGLLRERLPAINDELSCQP